MKNGLLFIIPVTLDFERGISSIFSSKLQAFIWDSSRLEYEAAKNCDLVTAGEMFGRSGFGVGMKQNSQWLKRMSLAILNMHERKLSWMARVTSPVV